MDPRVTRRSPRLQEAQRPQYPQLQPLSMPQTSAQSPFNSSSSLSSMSSMSTYSNESPAMDQGAQRMHSAPLPSPSQTQQMNYFDALRMQSFQQGQQLPQHQQQPQQQAPRQFGFQQTAQDCNGAGAAAQGSPETASFLNNLNLVAEAAKRAQMACLMRDLSEVEL